MRLPNNATDLETYIVWLIYCFYVIPSLNIHEKEIINKYNAKIKVRP